MIRSTALAAAFAIATLGGMAGAPAAQAQSSPQRLVCVDFAQVTWNSRVVIQQLDQNGSWRELLTVVTVPTRRCILTTSGIMSTANVVKVRFSVEAHEGGSFRMICRGEASGNRDATMLVTGNAVGASCIVRE